MAKTTFSELINNSDVPVLVDFKAEWCQPCHMLSPIIKNVAGKLQGKLKVVKVDIDQNPAVSQAYQIRGVPTMILFHKGKILWRQSGVLPESQIMQAVQAHLQ